MGSAESHIRVSNRVKEMLDGLKGDDESYNDVIERLVERQTGRDFTAGFGILSGSDTSGEIERARDAMNEQMGDRVDAITDGNESPR